MARLKLKPLLVALGAAGFACVAHADPVSLAATAIVSLGGYTGVAAFGIYLGAALINGYEARRKQRAASAQARAAYNASLEDRNVSGLRAEPSWKVVYGKPAPIGGAVVAIFTSGSKDEYKHLVVVFAAHESQAIDEIYIEGEPLGALDGAGWVQSGSKFFENLGGITITEALTLNGAGQASLSNPPDNVALVDFASAQGVYSSAIAGAQWSLSGQTITVSDSTNNNGAGWGGVVVPVTYSYTRLARRVNCQKHLSPGGVDTADSFLAAAVPNKWTSAHKLSGFTYAVITLDLNYGQFQGGPPNITALMRGKKVYDPRTSTTVFSNNAALCVADFLASSYGMGATYNQIDSAALIAAANACDSAGYTCDGVADIANGRDSNLAQLEDAMAGRTHFSGGVWRVMAGAWSTPVMTLDDATTLAGAIEVQQASYPSDQRFNSAHGQYIAGSSLGVAGDMTPYVVSSYVTADGYQKWTDLSFAFTPTASACTKLAAIAIEKSRLGLTILYPANMRCWSLQPGDRVYVNNGELGFTNKTFRVVDWAFDLREAVMLVLTEDAPQVWSGTFNVPDYQLTTSNLADPWARPAAPAALTATSGTNVLLRMGDGTIVTRVKATWTASVVRSILQGGYTQVQWRLASATDDQWVSQDLPGDAGSALFSGPQDGTNILVRVRWVSGFGVQGSWATVLHTVVGKTAPPTTPSYISATQDTVFWGAVTDVDLAGYRIRAYPGAVDGSYWSRGTPLHNDLLTTGPWRMTTTLYGLQTIMLAAEDTTGNQSPAIYTVLDYGLPPSANAVQSVDYAQLGWVGTITNGAVAGTALQANADAASDEYSLADVYAQPDLYATTYLGVTWVSQPFIPQFQGGTVSLDYVANGGAVEYQIDGSALNDCYSTTDLYAAADLYGASSAFAPWPGAVGVNRLQGVVFRLTLPAGSAQGQATKFAPSLVLPDVRQTFGNVAVPAAGLRLDPSVGVPVRKWIAVKTAQVTPVVDGNGAIGGRILDFSPSLGPLIQLVDGTGAAVVGRATIDIGGLADV